MVSLNKIIAKVNQIPLLSQTALQLLDVLGREEYDARDLTRIVRTDPGLSANILRLVNSAAFGLRQRVSSLEHAVSYLGERAVTGAALNMYASVVYENPMEGYGGESGQLWDHSIRTAMAAKELAGMTGGRVNPSVAYTCGLLHDIGKAVISEFLTDSVQGILAAIDSGETSDYLEAERHELGTDHAEIGAALAEHWNLPEEIAESIRFHHRPSDSGPEWIALVYVVHLADIVSMLGGTGTGADTLMYSLDSRYESYVDISGRELEKLILSVADEYEKTIEMFESLPEAET